MCRPSFLNALLLLLICLLLLCLVPGTVAQRPHEGVILNVLTLDVIAQNLERNKALFEERTGATVIVHGKAFAALYGQIDTELRSGANSVLDAFIFPPQFLVDFTTRGENGLEILTERVAADASIDWLDVFPFFRRFNSVGIDGQVYTIPLDGDMHALYYRTDVLESHGIAVPRTWEEFAAAAEQLHGEDFNGDGVPDYAVCLARGPRFQGGYFLLHMIAPYLQRMGTDEGFFFDVDTMEPLALQEGFRAGVEMYMRLREFGPPLEWNVVDAMEQMAAGRCALAPTWANVGPISRDTRHHAFSTWDKLGVSLLPGSEDVWDRVQQRWIHCPDELVECPLASGDGVNHAPLAANGGWAGGVPAAISQERRDAAYAFLAFMSSPEISNQDVLAGQALDPYRAGHFDLDRWVASGFDRASALNQIEGWTATLGHPNVAADLRMNGADEYMNVILDDLMWAMNNNNITQEQFVQQLYSRWNGLTESLGRAEQRRQYRALIGLPPPAEENDLSLVMRIVIIVLCAIALALSVFFAVFLAVQWRNQHFVYGNRIFMVVQLLGGVLTFCGAIVLASDITDATCQVTTWLFAVGIFLIYLALILRAVHVYYLVAAAMKFSQRRLTHLQVMIALVVAMLPVLVVLVVWQVVDPFEAKASEIDLSNDTYTVFCACQYPWWAVSLFVYGGVWLVIGVYAAIVSRSLAPALKESRAIALSAYNGIVCGGLGLLLALVVDSLDAIFFIVCLCALFAALVPLILSFVPKLYAIIKNEEAVSSKALIRRAFECRRCGAACQQCARTGMTSTSGPVSSSSGATTPRTTTNMDSVVA
mmetsp:Transcript_24890/g.62500  ORF Transcript_24890/g.62500 Transcript_24890/m.62500 type:complete len:820 (+) Transcript_24890:396-2855(+)|eukprot:CAMPEP_0177646930 /NCGR_PEP_ID=MMETSP0447-20121125/10030_1 /TAXON_ID=0 /ORGANISM="Stygamoeba regulata, Strain BSH-02190019" /LENGTH=819 /DNA_ID=CAMNT_0019149483 /DNA_START=308 /DNA_END=2767 /DNA_ORIENTATION=+